MEICHSFAKMFKLAGMMCSLKAFKLNSLYLWKKVYFETSCLVHDVDCVQLFDDFSALFEVQYSVVRKVILNDFVWRKGIMFIKKIEI